MLPGAMVRAVLIMCVAMSLIPAGDAAGKILTNTYGTSPVFVAWSRFVIGAALMAALLPQGTLALFADWRVWLRSVFITCAILCILTALKTEPLGNVYAAFFIGPVVSFALSILVLREPVTWLRSLLMGCGFLGVLVVVRPGSEVSVGILWAVAAGTFYGCFLTASRWIAHIARPRAMMLAQLTISAGLTTPLALWDLPALSAPVVTFATLSAACSMLGNLLLIVVYRMAPATTVAPMIYFQLFAATSLGWALFGDLPDAMTWAGLAIIIIAGVASARLAIPAPASTDRR